MVGRARIDDEMGFDQTGSAASAAHQRAAGLILADDAEKDAARAERGDVARNVAGAADSFPRASPPSPAAGASGEMRETSP